MPKVLELRHFLLAIALMAVWGSNFVLVPYALAWNADLIVAGNSAKNLLMRKLFGETAIKLLRESTLPLYLAQ